MNPILDAFWRAVAYCLRPRIVLLSLVPLVLMISLTVLLGYFFWEPALDSVRGFLESSAFLQRAWQWLDRAGLGPLKTVLAHLLIIFGITPLIVMVSLLVVTMIMTPMLARIVARRRFPTLLESGDTSFLQGLLWSLGSFGLALVALVVSVPLWLIPPLIFVVPPLIWGWLTYRVMAFDVLACHATSDERKALFHAHRYRLLTMGVFCGFLGAAPSVVWASGAMLAAAFVVLVPLAIWIYTLVFVFSSLWFAHYCLATLFSLRSQVQVAP
jgi:hypothetical protein